jgi:hypothetical protein
MSFRRILVAIIAGALASMLVAATAVAAGDPTVGTGGGTRLAAPSFVKIKGAKVYEYCDSDAGCYPPEDLELAIFNKTKTWEFTNNPEVGGPVVKPKKQKYTFLVYEDGYCDGCYLEGIKTKTGFIDGEFYYAPEESFTETWYANKL